MEARAPIQPPLVQLYAHFISTLDQTNNYPTDVRNNLISAQVFLLNQAFYPASILFQLAGTSHIVNDDWATDQDGTAMKQALRKGKYVNLNISFQTNTSSAPYTYNPQSILLGYCTLSTDLTYQNAQGGFTEYPAIDYATDGCNVLAASMPQSPFPAYCYDEGKTTVHEVGRWFGLLHTFQDNTCNPSNPGDYISDTPQERTSTFRLSIREGHLPGTSWLGSDQ